MAIIKKYLYIAGLIVVFMLILWLFFYGPVKKLLKWIGNDMVGGIFEFFNKGFKGLFMILSDIPGFLILLADWFANDDRADNIEYFGSDGEFGNVPAIYWDEIHWYDGGHGIYVGDPVLVDVYE